MMRPQRKVCWKCQSKLNVNVGRRGKARGQDLGTLHGAMTNMFRGPKTIDCTQPPASMDSSVRATQDTFLAYKRMGLLGKD